MSTSRELRLSVLRLAAAHPDDRQWIFGRLRPSARDRIEHLLREVQALGIEDYDAWLPRLRHDAPAPDTAAAPDARAAWAGLLLAAAERGEFSPSMQEQMRLEEMAEPVTDTVSLLPLPEGLRTALHTTLLGDAR